MKVARYIFGSNSAFSVVENKNFLEMLDEARPGYKPPNRHLIGEHYLDAVYGEEIKRCQRELENHDVTMSMDAWSNQRNESVIAITVTRDDGRTYLVKTINAFGKKHDGQMLCDIMKNGINEIQEKFKCNIRCVVTDNAANMNLARQLLEESGEFDVITYGCAAHRLDHLAEALEIPEVQSQVVDVCKYFRNNHFAAAFYAELGLEKLTIPSDVRWNTVFDCISLYNKNYFKLCELCEKYRADLKTEIVRKVENAALKRNAVDYMNKLQPLAVAVDLAQKDTAKISDVVHIFKTAESEVVENFPDAKREIEKYYKKTITDYHLVGYLIDPHYRGAKLTPRERDSALKFIHEKYPAAMPDVMKYLGKTLFSGMLF